MAGWTADREGPARRESRRPGGARGPLGRVPGSETEEIEAVLAAAAPFARGAWLQDRLEIAEGLARAFCWSYVPDVASGLAWGQPERAAVAQIFFEWAARNHAAMAAARGGAAAGFRS